MSTFYDLHLTAKDAAKELGRDVKTVNRWIREGHLKAVKMAGGPKGFRNYITREDVDRLRDELTIPEGYLSIGQASEITGISPSAVRYQMDACGVSVVSGLHKLLLIKVEDFERWRESWTPASYAGVAKGWKRPAEAQS